MKDGCGPGLPVVTDKEAKKKKKKIMTLLPWLIKEQCGGWGVEKYAFQDFRSFSFIPEALGQLNC